MIFQPDLAQAILDGEKTVTRRVVSTNPRSPWGWTQCGYREGITYAIQPGRGKAAVGRMRVLGVRKEPLSGVHAPGEVTAEGFAGCDEFMERWEQMHGTFDPDQPVWRVHFALVSPDSIPSATPSTTNTPECERTTA